MTLIVGLSLIEIMAAPSASAFCNCQSAEEFYNLGVVKQRAGDAAGAIADYSSAIEIDPKYAQAYDSRGIAKRAKGDLHGAIADFTRAVEIDPDYWRAYIERGFAKKVEGDLDGAMADYTKATHIHPRFVSGNLKRAMGDFVADFLTRVIELDPRDAEAYYNSGIPKKAKEDLNGAIDDYSRAVGLASRYVSPYYNRAIAKYAKKDYDGAIADFTRLIEKDPEDAEAYCNRGIAKRANGDPEGAIADFTRAIEVDASFGDACYNRGYARAMAGDAKGGIWDLTRSVEIKPSGFAFYARGCLVYNEQSWSEALADYFKARELMPKEPDYPELRIWLCRSRKGEGEAATTDWKRYLGRRQAEKANDWYSKMARHLLDEITESELLNSIDPKGATNSKKQKYEAQFIIGTKRLLKGNKPGAVEALTKCVEAGDKTDFDIYLSAKAELEALKRK